MIKWTHSKYVPDSVNAEEGDLVAVAFGKTKEIQIQRAKMITALPETFTTVSALITLLEASPVYRNCAAVKDVKAALSNAGVM